MRGGRLGRLSFFQLSPSCLANAHGASRVCAPALQCSSMPGRCAQLQRTSWAPLGCAPAAAHWAAETGQRTAAPRKLTQTWWKPQPPQRRCRHMHGLGRAGTCCCTAAAATCSPPRGRCCRWCSWPPMARRRSLQPGRPPHGGAQGWSVRRRLHPVALPGRRGSWTGSGGWRTRRCWAAAAGAVMTGACRGARPPPRPSPGRRLAARGPCCALAAAPTPACQGVAAVAVGEGPSSEPSRVPDGEVCGTVIGAMQAAARGSARAGRETGSEPSVGFRED